MQSYKKILLFLFLISTTLPVVDSPAPRAETRRSSPLDWQNTKVFRCVLENNRWSYRMNLILCSFCTLENTHKSLNHKNVKNFSEASQVYKQTSQTIYSIGLIACAARMCLYKFELDQSTWQQIGYLKSAIGVHTNPPI